jgi:hypothetical protein
MKSMELTPAGQDKIKRYGWIAKDTPGELAMIAKTDLHVDKTYQREAFKFKIMEIASAWSWIACGAIVVGKRNEQFWVIDGQHRVVASMRRSDITHLPCVVFDTEDVRQEARGFLAANTLRKPISAMQKRNALVAAGDDLAMFVDKTCAELGIKLTRHPKCGMETNSISALMSKASANRQSFADCLSICAELSADQDQPIPAKLFLAISYINDRHEIKADKRLSYRIRAKGLRSLVDAAMRASAFFLSSNPKTWAKGIIDEINKGLHSRISID